jgi:hypothetical protein
MMNIARFLPRRIVPLRSSHVFHWFMSTNADKSPMDQAPYISPIDIL